MEGQCLSDPGATFLSPISNGTALTDVGPSTCTPGDTLSCLDLPKGTGRGRSCGTCLGKSAMKQRADPLSRGKRPEKDVAEGTGQGSRERSHLVSCSPPLHPGSSTPPSWRAGGPQAPYKQPPK